MQPYKHKPTGKIGLHSGDSHPFLEMDGKVFIPIELVKTGSDWEEVRVLFHTNDGVAYYDKHEEVDLVDKNWEISTEYAHVFLDNPKDYLAVFSTGEKAEEWVLDNKPCLSINDAVMALSHRPSETVKRLKEIVKSKL